MAAQQVSDWDPRDPTVLIDQRQAYDQMRERCPVAYSDSLGWSLFRYDDVLQATGDPHNFSNATARHAVPNGWDPPEQTLYRRALDPYFSPERIREFEPRARQVAMALVESLLASDEADFIAEFAEPYLLDLLSEFLGWPVEDWALLRDWTRANAHATFTEEPDERAAVSNDFSAYVMRQLEARRSRAANPSEDITSGLLALQVDGKQLSDDDIIGLLRNYVAGAGTTVDALGIAVLHLVEDQALQQQLRVEPSLVPAFIEETLRCDGPLVANGRTATADVEIGEHTVLAGDHVSLMWIAANRDERVFTQPDAVCLERDSPTHLAFGAGIHVCMGAPLVRLEMRVALEELLARSEHLSLAVPGRPSRNVYPSNGLSALRLRSRDG
jgi:cytochrome P450